MKAKKGPLTGAVTAAVPAHSVDQAGQGHAGTKIVLVVIGGQGRPSKAGHLEPVDVIVATEANGADHIVDHRVNAASPRLRCRKST